ncbi:hypothetical protein C8F01DRAFT_1352483 [Mycena amicta]|nr:hypothetical protein C8F01DRAFT_1352483 [Mycena amicta]
MKEREPERCPRDPGALENLLYNHLVYNDDNADIHTAETAAWSQPRRPYPRIVTSFLSRLSVLFLPLPPTDDAVCQQLDYQRPRFNGSACFNGSGPWRTQAPPSPARAFLSISYDIVCQWKWHAAGHDVPFQGTVPGLGLFDGERAEPLWSSHRVKQAPPKTLARLNPDWVISYIKIFLLMSDQRKHPRKRANRHVFRVGNVRLKQGDQVIHFLPNNRGTRTHLVNVEPTHRPRLGLEANNTFGSWSPMDKTGWEDSGMADDVVQVEAPRRRRYIGSDDPMRLWRRQISSYLDELLHSEGLGRHHQHPRCAVCGADGLQLFWCRPCGQFLQCEMCLREQHQQQPLHRPEVWNGNFWAPCSLYRDPAATVQLGMVYQLGHHGFECPYPVQRSKDRVSTLTVLDQAGIFKVDVQFCGCSDSLRHPHGHLSQLMDNGWYPATTLEPSTCATYALLELFRLLKVVANVNANDLDISIKRGYALILQQDRYKSFIRMSRQWDFLTRAKRAGRGHQPDGVKMTPPGGLAVRCWACPDPGRNMPDGWENGPEDEVYRHSLLLAMDANFRLKNGIRANERHDPSLGPGLGHFVLSDTYKYFLRHYVAEEDVSTCIAFAALMQKETRLTTGLRVSAVRPMGLGDLQKGERYANMDWILLSAVDGIGVKDLLLSYDIACQWKQRLAIRAAAVVLREAERLEDLAEEEGWEDEERVPAIRTELAKYLVKFGLPVWHSAAHEASCQAANSLSHAVGVGRTDGEGIERTWAILNPIGYSTKEMGEGHRHDTIDDKVDHINFEKNVKEDPSAPNPYMMDGKHAGPTEGQILADLKKAELEDVRAGRGEAMIGKMTGVAFIKAGLQLKDLQFRRRIRAEVKATVTMTADRASQLDKLRVSFFKKLRNWETNQSVFMPAVEDMRAEEEEKRDRDVAPPLAEDTKLWLPSDLTNDQRRRDWPVRRCPRQATGLFAHEAPPHRPSERQRRRQLASTRSNTLIGRITGQGHREMTKYRDARRAGLQLKPMFCPHFQVLNDDDARVGVEVESDAAARAALGSAGTSRRVRNEPTVPKTIKPVSWIWSVGGEPDSQELHDSVRVQWTKAKARHDRWVEEVEIVWEEMRRVLWCLETVQREWRGRAEGRNEGDAELAAGARAYAMRQQAIYQHVALSFRAQWSTSAAEAVRRVVNEVTEDADDDEVDPEDNEEQGFWGNHISGLFWMDWTSSMGKDDGAPSPYISMDRATQSLTIDLDVVDRDVPDLHMAAKLIEPRQQHICRPTGARSCSRPLSHVSTAPPIALPRPPNSALATPASRTIQSTQRSKHYAYGHVPIIRPGSEAVHLAPDDGYRRLVKNDREDSALPTSSFSSQHPNSVLLYTHGHGLLPEVVLANKECTAWPGCTQERVGMLS